MRVALIIIGDEVLGAEVEDRNITPLLQWAAAEGHVAQSVQVVGDEIDIVKVERSPRRRRNGHVVVQPAMHPQPAHRKLGVRCGEVFPPVHPRAELRVPTPKAYTPAMSERMR